MIDSKDLEITVSSLCDLDYRFKKAYEMYSALYSDGKGKFSHWKMTHNAFSLYGNKHEPYASPDFTLSFVDLLEGWDAFVIRVQGKVREKIEDNISKEKRRVQLEELKKEFEPEPPLLTEVTSKVILESKAVDHDTSDTDVRNSRWPEDARQASAAAAEARKGDIDTAERRAQYEELDKEFGYKYTEYRNGRAAYIKMLQDFYKKHSPYHRREDENNGAFTQ